MPQIFANNLAAHSSLDWRWQGGKNKNKKPKKEKKQKKKNKVRLHWNPTAHVTRGRSRSAKTAARCSPRSQGGTER